MELEQEAKLKSVSCANCGAPIQIFSPDSTISVGCSKCGSISSVSHDVSAIVSKFENKIKRAISTDLPIGVKGKFRGQIFQVRGMIAKSDTSEGWWWQEYLLFNPYVGNRWLVCFRGHWTYFTPIKDIPDAPDYALRVKFRGRKYLLHTREPSKVQYAVGEFYWEIRPEDKVFSRDFVNPPEMLSEEKDGNEVSWALGEYIESDVIRNTFIPNAPKDNKFPKPSGTVAHQPFPASPFLKKIGLTCLTFLMIMFLCQVATLMILNGRVVTSYRTDIMAGKDGTEFKSEPFKIDANKNLMVKLDTDLDNNWMEVEADLVEVASGKTYPLDSVIEYYHGYEGGESWSEGSRTREVGLRDIPPSEYILAGSATTGSQSPVHLDFIAKKNTPTWFLYILFCLPFLIVGFLAFVVRQLSYRSRWNDSDFQEELFGGSS